jgi:hypothetical protein
MFLISNNNKSSEFLIINIKPDLQNNLYKEITLDDEFNILNNWIQLILDRYDLTLNWNYYMINIDNKYYRIFLFINKHQYLNLDDDSILYNNKISVPTLLIDIHKLTSLFKTIDLYVAIQYLKKKINNSSQIILLDPNYHNIIHNEIENLNDYNGSKKYYNIGISGINKYEFYKELSKIEILLNNKTENYNITYESLYIKIKEFNTNIWISINQDINYIKYFFNKFEKFTLTPNKNKNI